MRLSQLTILSALLWVSVGCATQKPWLQAGAQQLETINQPRPDDQLREAGKPTNQWTARITAYAAACPPIPNARVQLPAVSPDAAYIAYLQTRSDNNTPGADSLITGTGLAAVSLWVRELEEETEPTMVASSGACWPSWSRDGRSLVFVTFDRDRHSALGIFDVETGMIQRKSVGLRCVLMPSLSPDNSLVAVSAYGEIPDHALIFIIDPRSAQATPGPPSTAGAQLYPRWINNNTLIFLELTEEGVNLKRWSIGDQRAATLAQLPGPASIFDAHFMLAAINNPLRPDIGAYAYLNTAENRVEIHDLESDTTRALPMGFQSGSWWGDDWLISANNDRVELVSSRRTSGTADKPRMVRALTGRWLPIWADHATQAAILIGASEDPDAFALLRLWLVAEDDG